LSSAATFKGAGAEIFNDHVCRAHQLPRDRNSSRGLEVQADAALVAVVHREIAGAGALEHPSAIAADGLDARHLGPQIGEYQARRRPHDHVREFQYP
jgi:hypothetical protein